MADHFDDAFVDALVSASAARSEVAGSSGVVGLGIGKKVLATLEIVDGRVVGSTDAEPAVTIVFTGAQVESWKSGELNLSQAYMRGDLKPVGHTGPLTAALEIFDDADVVAALGA